MVSNISRPHILAIYKSLLRESQKFSNYNFRLYALRRVRDAFKEHKSLQDHKLIKKEYDFAKDNLEIIKRQVVIGEMYRTDKLVIENQQ
ncbi:PREDICTED: LYR motif-containing protein 4 [Papilio xuthus]|uniref:LYR motif-containing protein 4 n=1 Tax=Papilio xuthus TaxID=66420 RepID=A0A194PSP1_PAPXU|nr:PREDICTED: LYR motif-containing protein 4 [Papilio xuthus]KPI96451.1 LYR motif-containing protein 4 [Papilio xuthus]